MECWWLTNRRSGTGSAVGREHFGLPDQVINYDQRSKKSTNRRSGTESVVSREHSGLPDQLIN